MDVFEQRMEKRLGNAENSLDRIVDIQGDVVEMLKGQREEILETRQHNDRLAIVQRDVVEILKEQREEILERQHNDRLAIIQRDVVMLKEQREEILEIIERLARDVVEMLKEQRQEVLEMKRFNQQTRQLWVLIARKMDWLDEDLDIDSL